MRRLYQAESAERERVQRTLTPALESEPDLEFAWWLYGSFLSGAGFRDVDVGGHLTAPPEVRFRRGWLWRCDWIAKTGSRCRDAGESG